MPKSCTQPRFCMQGGGGGVEVEPVFGVLKISLNLAFLFLDVPFSRKFSEPSETCKLSENGENSNITKLMTL